MQSINYDSEFCGKVPIHLTNLIQPYGVLIVVNGATDEIIQVSENSAVVFGVHPDELIHCKLTKFLGVDVYQNLLEKFTNEITLKIPCVWTLNGIQYPVLVHKQEDLLLIEVEVKPFAKAAKDTFVEVYPEIKYAMAAIDSAESLRDTCALAAKELKRISGFHKVMIYRFDENWNGTVMAEEKEDTMESYLGFTFPASDIPRQARELYLKNPYRFIPDKDYVPVKLYPVVNPITGAFIDLSVCNLRSVAAVHLEYLKNMGVVASMSVRILYKDKLWGLIACHHQKPKYMSYDMCSIFEMLSTILSVKISSLEERASLSIENFVATTYSQIIETIFKTGDLNTTFLSDYGLKKLFSANGMAITTNEKKYISGITPSDDQIDELLLWLHTRELKKVFFTERLSAEYEYAKDYASKVSGLLVIPINYTKDHYIMLFRQEQITVINWGGNPDERITFEKDNRNYHPRHSFKEWQQKVIGVSLPWKKEEIKVAEKLRCFIFENETPNTEDL